MDRLQTMSVFVTVAEETGFAPAARRLNISPPSVTRAVSELEQRLGAKLLHRTTRSVRLTDAGHRYLEDCRRILSEIEEVDRHAAGIHAAPSGTVTVTASLLFGRMVLNPLVLDLLDRYDEISISAIYLDRIAHLVDEGIDIAVRIGDLPDSSMKAARVGSVRRVLCASPAYLAEHGRPKTPADLSAHRLIDFVNMTPGGEWTFDHDGKKHKHKPKSRLRVTSADAAIAAAKSDRGITRVLSYMIAPELQGGDLSLVLDHYAPAAVPVHVVHKEPGQTSARVRAVVDHFVDALRQEPALDH